MSKTVRKTIMGGALALLTSYGTTPGYAASYRGPYYGTTRPAPSPYYGASRAAPYYAPSWRVNPYYGAPGGFRGRPYGPSFRGGHPNVFLNGALSGMPIGQQYGLLPLRPPPGLLGPPLAVFNGLPEPMPPPPPSGPPGAFVPPPGPPPGSPPGPPPGPPLGWIITSGTQCANPPQCSMGVVATDAAGVNVRQTPNGVPIVAIANGTPLIQFDRTSDGRWILIAPACTLVQVNAYSVTANVPFAVCGG